MDKFTIIRPELLSFSSEQVRALLPYFWVFLGTVLTILASVLRTFNPKWPVFLLTILTCGFGISSSLKLMHEPTVLLFNGMMVSDVYSHFFNIIYLSSAALTAFVSLRYLDKEGLQHPEYYVLLLFSALGMMLMSSSLDLIVFFIALELMSLAVYILVGFRRADRKSNEASMKYFILGSVASAVLLYGAALLYGATGFTGIKMIFASMRNHPEGMSPLFSLGAGLVLIGFLFKIASVPFHMWMPDVYEGAPAPVTGFMTTGLKAAAFASLIRVFFYIGSESGLASLFHQHIHAVLWVSAVLTMLVGNFVALTQTNLKRMLAYSSIAHTGYLLVGILSGPQSELGYMPTLLYLVAYAVMNLGAFVCLSLLSGRGDSGLNLHDIAGISRRHPYVALSLGIFLLSMASIPPTAGFAAKYLLFYSAIQAQEIPLVVIGVLCSAVSVYYYLRVLVYMYMRDPVGSPSSLRVSVWSGFALAAMVLLTLQIGVLPERLIHIALKAMTSL